MRATVPRESTCIPYGHHESGPSDVTNDRDRDDAAKPATSGDHGRHADSGGHSMDDPAATEAEHGSRAKHHTHDWHEDHEGHDPTVFRGRFGFSLVLTLPVVFWSEHIQGLLGYRAPAFPGSDWIAPVLGTVVSSWVVQAGIIDAQALWWELATLVSIMLLGHRIEMRSISQAQAALQELAKLVPDTATRITDGGEETVGVDELRRGDVVLVRPGESVPVTGSSGRGRAPWTRA